MGKDELQGALQKKKAFFQKKKNNAVTWNVFGDISRIDNFRFFLKKKKDLCLNK